MASAQGATTPDAAVLEVRDLHVEFRTKRGVGRAVNGATFSLRAGETLGLVGESGSGKTITALSIIGLHPQPAARITHGSISFHGKDLSRLSAGELRKYRGRRIGLIPQDPMTSLNPVFSIAEQILETLRMHLRLKSADLRERAVQLLSQLHIAAARERLSAFPHQLSGGMRQRIVGAIVLGGEPEVIIADEPTTSLDATVQSAYLELLREIQEKTGTAILFITHDFGVVAALCDRVAVMYAGYVVETAQTKALFDRPAHPYTQALIASVPDLDTVPERLPSITGQPPSIYALPQGCPFASRCAHVMDKCRQEFPPVRELEPEHTVACWLYA
jgi:oligopeptide/dipeptide ABC transporter ATP-binding protein